LTITRIAAVLGLLFFSGAVFADSFAVRSMTVVGPSDLPERQSHRQAADAKPAVGTDSVTHGPMMFPIYPVAGKIGEDLFIPYYVDLDPTDGIRDWNCGTATFDTHRGHDPYIRSFAEQEIGVPVFTPLDGRVIDVRDGEPDQNVVADPALRSNYVVIEHANNQRTIYEHLRRGIPVTAGQYVHAGTEIGMVGSSGASVAPHIHFESRYEGVAYEPFAGPCRPGVDMVRDQPLVVPGQPRILGLTFSNESFAQHRPAPFDDATRTGTFLTGSTTIFVKADLANVRPNTTYGLRVVRPNGTAMAVGQGTISSFGARRTTVVWEIATVLESAGDWTLEIEVDGTRLASAPFRAVTAPSQIVNRPPMPVQVRLDPVGASEVAQCVIDGPAIIVDPDYDVVRYRYRWTLDGEVAREVTTAARTDVLARDKVTGGKSLRCEVVVSDGTLETQPVFAQTTVELPLRRRPVR
jgi:hypothetical protein